jgi:hypothetical protein
MLQLKINVVFKISTADHNIAAENIYIQKICNVFVIILIQLKLLWYAKYF